MSTKKTRHEGTKAKAVEHEVEAGASGALAGAVFGAAAGPPGIAVGAAVGAIAGALVGSALDKEAAVEAEHTSELDDAIGVTKGDLGAPNLRHPAAKIGAYSGASVGRGAAGEASATPAEGGIEPPADED
jgi:uncharacterized membrane protein